MARFDHRLPGIVPKRRYGPADGRKPHAAHSSSSQLCQLNVHDGSENGMVVSAADRLLFLCRPDVDSGSDASRWAKSKKLIAATRCPSTCVAFCDFPAR